MQRHLQPSNAMLLCGTEPLGPDILSRIVYGLRVSLLVGFASMAIGTLLGLVSGYWEGGWTKGAQRAVDTTIRSALTLFAVTPTIVLGLLLEKYITRGIVMGSLKW